MTEGDKCSKSHQNYCIQSIFYHHSRWVKTARGFLELTRKIIGNTNEYMKLPTKRGVNENNLWSGFRKFDFFVFFFRDIRNNLQISHVLVFDRLVKMVFHKKT